MTTPRQIQQDMEHEAALIDALLGGEAGVSQVLLGGLACGLCAQTYDPRITRMRPTLHGTSVCPTCAATARGQRELETMDERDARLFGFRRRS